MISILTVPWSVPQSPGLAVSRRWRLRGFGRVSFDMIKRKQIRIQRWNQQSVVLSFRHGGKPAESLRATRSPDERCRIGRWNCPSFDRKLLFVKQTHSCRIDRSGQRMQLRYSLSARQLFRVQIKYLYLEIPPEWKISVGANVLESWESLPWEALLFFPGQNSPVLFSVP